MDSNEYPLLFVESQGKSIDYTGRRGGGKFDTPSRDRILHGNRLERQFESAWEQAEEKQKTPSLVSVPTQTGVYLDFRSQPGYEMKIKSLESLSGRVRLLNVQRQGEDGQEEVRATVYVPNEKRDFFLKKIRAYCEENTKKTGKPKNQP